MACSGGVCISGTCCPSNATVTLKSKAAWQADVNTEVLADSGLDMTQFDPSKPFSGQKGYVQAAYKYYEKRFLEHPDIFLWAGLAKLAGAPVYAGLSDLENGGAITDLSSFTLRLAQLLGVPAGTLGVVAPALLDAFTNLAPQIQRNLMAINRTVFFDIAWQLKAYAAPDGGLCALEYIASVDPEALDISAWRSIDQGLRENNTALIAAGNLELLYREQHDVVQPILGATTSPGRVLTAFTLNPVPNGISFLEWALDLWFVNPTAVFSLPTFDKRWNWINAPDRGMWSLWIQANSSTRRVWVGQPLTGPTGRAQTYALFPDLVE